MTSRLDAAVDGIVERVIPKSVEKLLHSGALDEIIAKGILKAVDDLKPTQRLSRCGFGLAIGSCFWRGGMSPKEAIAAGHRAVNEWLAFEKINYGDKNYYWNLEEAREIAREEMEHWDS